MAFLAHLAAAQPTSASLHGTVHDSVHARALGGATVIATPVSGTRDTVFHSAVTDARGRFSLEGLQTGSYMLTVEHPWIDSTSIGAPPVQVDVAPAREAVVALGIPSPATLRRVLCGAASRDTSLGVVTGTVRRSGDGAVPGARVVLTWGDFEVDRGTATVKRTNLSASATADSQGVYRACGVPIARSLLVQAQAGDDEQSGVIEEQIGEAAVLVRDIRLAPPATGVVAASENVVTGRILSTANRGIGGAQVRVFGGTRSATTSDDGEFRITGVPGGTQGIEVLALGYYPRRVRVDVGPEAQPLAVRLERTALVLDSIRVTAKKVNSLRRFQYREFDQRLVHGAGFYITEEQIEQQHPFETGDLLKSVPGVRVFGFGADLKVAAARGRTNIGNTECPLDIFVDGIKTTQLALNSIPPHVLHGIEVYTVATAPARYNVGPCGAVFLWTR